MRHFDKLLCFCPKSFDQGCSNTLCNTGVGGTDKGVKTSLLQFLALHSQFPPIFCLASSSRPFLDCKNNININIYDKFYHCCIISP